MHIDCLKEATIKLRSENEEVKCPNCEVQLQTYELNEYLDQEEQLAIEKAQTLQIVKLNPSFVSCSCGNIMELIPGDVIKG